MNITNLMIMMANSTKATTKAAGSGGGNPFETMAAPVISLLNMVLVPAIGIVGALGTIYCIFLGVKLAKAEEPQDREKAKNALKNAIIGFVLIFVLIVVMKAGMSSLSQWAGVKLD